MQYAMCHGSSVVLPNFYKWQEPQDFEFCVLKSETL